MELDQEAIELARELVRIDSSDPGAYEGEIQEFIRAWLLERIERLRPELAGRAEVSLEQIEPLAGRKCLRARIVPAAKGEALLPELVLLSHMDTVTLGEGWSKDTPALGAVVRDGRLWGRGSCDMKGGMACAMLAFDDALGAVANDLAPRRALSFIATCDEEDFMRGSDAAIRAGWLDGSQWVLDTEPTDGYVRMAHKGRTWFEMGFSGVTAHASTPWMGADAVAATACAIDAIRREVGELPEDDELGKTTVTFGQVQGGYRPYVVPDSCTTWIDMRLAPPCTPRDAQDIVEHAIALAEGEVPGTHGSLKVTGDRPAIPSHADSPLLAKMRAATLEVCGSAAETKTFTGYTDSAVVAGTCENPNCASYGPGSLEVAHKPNEFVPLEDLARVRSVFRRLVLDCLE